MPKVLMVLTSHDTLGDTGRDTGFYVGEAAHPYAVFAREGIEVDFVSPRGGTPPQNGVDRGDAAQAAFLDDPAVASALAATLTPADVDPADYDAVLYVGGHGTMWDFPDNEQLADITRQVWEAGGAVSAVCHGPAGLINVQLSDGSYLVAGKTVAAFTDAEELAVGLHEVVPFLLASTLVQRGAHHTTAANFQPNVEVDGRLVTGQNPASAAPLAEALVGVIRARRPAGVA